MVFNDVTALKEAQQELQQNRDLLRSVFDVSYNGLSVLRSVRDEEGNLLDMEYILANKATKQTNQRDDLEGKLYSTVHAGFKGTDYFDVVKRVVETGEPHQYQLHYNFEHLDNWYNITTVKLDDGVLLSFEDISEIKKAELALRKSEERHAFLLTLSDVLRPISDPVEIQGKASRVIGEYLNANRTYYAEIDTSRQRAIVKQDYDRSNVQSLVGSHDLQLYAGVIAGMHQERMLIAEDFASTPLVPDHERAAFDALSIRAFVSVPLIKGGTLVASLTVTNDTARRWTPQEVHLLQEVSERTWAAVERAKAQAELRLSEENYQTLFNSIDEGFQHVEVLYDEAGNAVDYLILAQNPAADRLLGPVIRAGYKASEVVPSGTTAAVNPEWLAIYDSVVKTGNPVRRQVYVEPMDRWFDFYMTRSGDPSLHHTVSLFQDVTGSKKTEQALKEADRRKDEFLAMLAHELRNPMAPIRNGLQIMSLTCGDDPMLSSLVDMMNRQVDHLVRLVDDLLDVSRISRGKIELVLERLELGNLVSQAVEAARPQYQQRRVQLGLTLSQTPMYLRGDAARLNQVITNLLTNGVRYTPEGGEVRVTLELVNNESDGTRPDRSALLRVTDTGIGLAPDQLTAVFELFVQMDNSLARSQGGLGLGLTLVRKLVEMHGGWVEAHSKGLSEGSEFRVYLPLLAEPAKTINPATEQASAQLPGHTILVVDDNRDAADSLSMFLALKGHQVHTRYGGREALEAVTTVQPTVVLLDIGMPDLDGYQTCQLIRQQAGNQHIALIALTGYGQVEDKQRSQEAGFYTHVVKPVDLTALTQLLTSLPINRPVD